MSRVRSNRVCFTVNNYETEIYDELDKFIQQEQHKIKFMCIGEEIGKSGTPHLQGFIHIDEQPRNMGIKAWKEYMPAGFTRAHFSNARGTDEQNEKYCSKDGPFITVGKPTNSKDKFQEIFELAKTDVEAAIAIDYEFGIKNYNALQAINRKHYNPQMQCALPELREWQQRVMEKLKNQPERKILFVVDSEGGKGKSVLCKHLLSTENSWACQGKRSGGVQRSCDYDGCAILRWPFGHSITILPG